MRRALAAAVLLAAACAKPAPGPYAVFETSKGRMVARLFPDRAPKTVAHFTALANGTEPWRDRDGKTAVGPLYDRTVFHRVIPGFMIQTGDPTGTGRGGPGWTILDEFHPKLRHDKAGVVSMANAGPDTGGSQFFITHGPTPHLDDRHAIFGQVIEGQDVVTKIAAVKRGPGDRPVEPVRMERVTLAQPLKK